MASNVRFVDSLKVGAYDSSGTGGGGSAITINNNVNNYLLSATGNPNIINGEANLTFDGNTLTLRGDLVIEDQGAGADLILIQNPSGKGISVNSSGTLILTEFSSLPSAVDGGIVYFSDEFYVGLG
mgnify:CR=1 FL=1|jgi:hypothetical protein|tara:strand:+ start:730 stop:1107 length:378 start_codon:yes stop_codon:yes gene_type:complete